MNFIWVKMKWREKKIEKKVKNVMSGIIKSDKKKNCEQIISEKL